MTIKQFKQIRVAIILFVLILVIFASTSGSYLLSLVAVVTGMIFLVLARSTVKRQIDERQRMLREKSAQLTYAIFAPTIAFSSIILLVPYKKLSPVFKHAQFAYLESLGMLLAYLSLFMIVLYAISYYFLNKKYGGGSDEK